MFKKKPLEKCTFCGKNVGNNIVKDQALDFCSRFCKDNHEKMQRKVLWFRERKEFNSILRKIN
ncbi:MAG: hypothetical protein GY863_15240 [bacterium]|nr:hypothetical protein [bacterium]